MAFRVSSKVAEMKLRDLHSKFPIRVPLAGAIPSSRLGVEKADYVERVSEQRHHEGQPATESNRAKVEDKGFEAAVAPNSVNTEPGEIRHILLAWKGLGVALDRDRVVSHLRGLRAWQNKWKAMR